MEISIIIINFDERQKRFSKTIKKKMISEVNTSKFFFLGCILGCFFFSCAQRGFYSEKKRQMDRCTQMAFKFYVSIFHVLHLEKSIMISAQRDSIELVRDDCQRNMKAEFQEKKHFN